MYRAYDPITPPWIRDKICTAPAGDPVPSELKEAIAQRREEVNEASRRFREAVEAAQAVCGHPINSRHFYQIEFNSRDVGAIVSCSDCHKVLLEISSIELLQAELDGMISYS